MFTYDLGDGAQLRILQRSDAPAFLQFIQDNRAYLAEWLDWTTRVHTVEDAERFIQRGLDRFVQDGLPWVAIFLNGAMAGGILFFPIETRSHSTEIGYWLGAQAAGHGLMTRAIPPMLDFAFDKIGLNRVGLFADVRNARSRAVAERLGFAFEGVKRDGWTHNEAFIDVAMYSMLARDWRKRYGKWRTAFAINLPYLTIMVQTLRRVHWTPTRLAILLLGSVTIALELVGFIRNIPAVHPKPVAGDFGTYYAAALLQRDRPELLYDYAAQDEVAHELGMATVGNGYLYLPFFATLLQPFTLFELPNAARLWIALCLAAFLASAHLLLKVARLDARLPFTLLAFGLALIFPPVVTDFIYGNVNILFLLMLTAAVYLLDKTPAASRRDLFAGVLIGATIAFKFYPALLLIPIAAARRWRVIAGSIVAVGAALIVGLLGANGIANTVRYISGGAPTFIIPWEPFNQSLVGALRRLFEPYLYTFPVFELGNLLEMQAQPLVNAPALVMPIFILLAVAVFAVTLYALWRMSSAVPLRLKIALFLTMALILTPLLWEYYAVLLLLPFAIWLSFHDRFDTSLLMVTLVTFVLTLHRFWKPLALLGVPFWALSFGLLAIVITWGYTLYAAKHLGD